jgi:ArsR family transcriptional regulator
MIVDTTSGGRDRPDPLPSCCGSVAGDALTETQAADLAVALKALADPVRLRLVSIVATSPSGEVCACDLPAAVGRSQPTISHHLSLLVDAGVLEREQRGKWAWFRLQPQRLDELSAVLAPTPRIRQEHR